MINQLTIMLYVKNVEETAEFWETYLSFKCLEKIEIGPFVSIVLGNEKDFSFQLFDREFIKQVSPEVSLETPSIMFYVDNLDETHKRLEAGSTFVSEITFQGERAVFNFADNEGRYFACSQL